MRRASEAWDLGATEVCIQAGLPPKMDGYYYVDSAEGDQGASCPTCTSTASRRRRCCTARCARAASIEEYLRALKEAGVGRLPGTSAEILDQEVRDTISPGRITTKQWVRGDHGGAPRSASRRPRRSCTATSRRRGTGPRTSRLLRDIQKRDRRLHRVRAAVSFIAAKRRCTARARPRACARARPAPK